MRSALLIAASMFLVMGCSSRIQSVHVPYVPYVTNAPSDWVGAAVYVDSDVGDLTAILREAFAGANFIVVGTREEAVLVVSVRQSDTEGEGGSRGGQGYVRSQRTLSARATLDGRPIADGEVTLKFTIAEREDESDAEFEWRQDLEETAARKWLGNSVVIDLVEHLPLRASIAAPAGSGSK